MQPPVTTPSRFTRVERFDTIVIGAGQAGLAVGYHLAAREIDFVILDSAPRVGDTWRNRWDSLRLFTTAARSGLPAMHFPAPPGHLPDRDEVADYLERYAERMDLPIRLSCRVDSLGWDGERYTIRAGDEHFEVENVVVATGPFQRPRVPAVAGQLSGDIRQLHSSDYRNPFDLPEGPVLVVGAGNSGAQIALELARFRKVWLAGRESGHLPRRVLGRDVFDWLWPVLRRITAHSALGRRVRKRSGRADPLVGMPRRALTRAGVQRVGRVTGERGGLFMTEATGIVPMHAHYAIQIAFCSEPGIGFRTSDDADWTEYGGAMIPSRQPHSMNITEGLRYNAVIFVEPETREGRALTELYLRNGIAAIPQRVLASTGPALFAAWREERSKRAIIDAARRLIHALTQGVEPMTLSDERIMRAVAFIKRNLDARLTLDDVAAEAYLSPSRFRHLFVEQTGMALRPYILWRRFLRVWELLMAGESLSTAAHAAGFADAAHLTRTSRSMFGFTPSTIRLEGPLLPGEEVERQR